MIDPMFHYHFTQEDNYYSRTVVYHDDHFGSLEHDGLGPGQDFDGELEVNTKEGTAVEPAGS